MSGALAGLSRIVVIRHANTDRPPNDLDRQLTEKGRAQCAHAAGSWAAALGSGPNVFRSRAQRTAQNAELIAGGCAQRVVECIYPDDADANSPNRESWNKINVVFARLGHVPLQEYIDHDDGALALLIDEYAVNVWKEVLAVLEEGQKSGQPPPATLAIFAHSIFGSAIAWAIARGLRLEEELILSTKVDEACAFVIEPGSQPAVRYHGLGSSAD